MTTRPALGRPHLISERIVWCLEQADIAERVAARDSPAREMWSEIAETWRATAEIYAMTTESRLAGAARVAALVGGEKIPVIPENGAS